MATATLLFELMQLLDSTTAAAPPRPAKNRPPTAEVAAARADNFADAMTAVLKCYHKTATYQTADVIGHQWERQAQYGAQKSAVVRINYSGLSGARYQMDVAVMIRPTAVRTHLLNDNASIKASKSCALERWTSAGAAKTTAGKAAP